MKMNTRSIRRKIGVSKPKIWRDKTKVLRNTEGREVTGRI